MFDENTRLRIVCFLGSIDLVAFREGKAVHGIPRFKDTGFGTDELKIES